MTETVGSNDLYPEHTLPRLLFEQAQKYGDRVALRRKEFGLWNEIAWADYAKNVRQVGAALIADLNPKRDECISLISENRPEWLFTDLGIQATGAISAAIYSTSAPEQMHYILDHCKARAIFVEDEEQLDKVLEVRGQLPRLQRIVVYDMEGLREFDDPMVMSFADYLKLGEEEEAKDTSRLDAAIAEGVSDEVALLVYTSGTTGPPKGAMLTHRNLIWTAGSMAECNPIHETDEVLSFLPLCHVAERMMTTINQLRLGYTASFAESLETVSDNLREVSPTVFFAVPRIWEKFHSKIELQMDRATWFKRKSYQLARDAGLRVARAEFRGEQASAGQRALARLAHWTVFRPLRERLGLERVRFAISGAAPISLSILEYFHAIGLPVHEVYGQTEGSGPSTIHHGADFKPGTVGQPLPGVDVRIADDGEILVHGPNVFPGYLGDEAATAGTVIDGWLHSGDVGDFDEDGHLRITDRKKDLIITAGGKNIAPQHIENMLKASPYINDAVVIGDRRKFLTGLILIDEENVSQWAQDHRVPFTTYKDLATNEEVRELIKAEIEAVNDKLAQVERIKKHTVLDKRLEEEDGEVTPTLKVKRKKISEIYSEQIEAMYGRR